MKLVLLSLIAWLGLTAPAPSCPFTSSFVGFSHVRIVTPFVATTNVVAVPQVAVAAPAVVPLTTEATCATPAFASSAVAITPFASVAVVRSRPLLIRSRGVRIAPRAVLRSRLIRRR